MGFFDQFGDWDGYLQSAMQAATGDAGINPMPQQPEQPAPPAPPPFANAIPMPPPRPQGAPQPQMSGGGIGSDYAGSQMDPNAPDFSVASMMSAPTGMPSYDPTSQPPVVAPPPRSSGIGSDYASSGGQAPPPVVPLPPTDPRTAMAASPASQPPAMTPPNQPWSPPPTQPMQIHPQAGDQPGIDLSRVGLPQTPPAPQGGQTQGGGVLGSNGGFLQNVLGLSSDRSKQIMAGIGKGAASITGSGRFASFARGTGQGIQGSQAEENTQFDEKLKSLNAAIQARRVGDMDAYKTNYLKYLGQNAQNKADAATNKPTAWNKPPAQRYLDAQRLFSIQQKQLFNELQLNNKDLPQDQRARNTTEYQARSAKLQSDILAGVGMSPQEAAGFSNNPPGTAVNPHKPVSKQDFDAYVKPGQYYINPRDGKTYMRKTDSAPDAAPEQSAGPAASGQEPAPYDPTNPMRNGTEDREDRDNAA